MRDPNTKRGRAEAEGICAAWSAETKRRDEMSAKNGLTRSFRLLGCLMAVALLASALFASAASAKTEPTNPTAYINHGRLARLTATRT